MFIDKDKDEFFPRFAILHEEDSREKRSMYFFSCLNFTQVVKHKPQYFFSFEPPNTTDVLCAIMCERQKVFFILTHSYLNTVAVAADDSLLVFKKAKS